MALHAANVWKHSLSEKCKKSLTFNIKNSNLSFNRGEYHGSYHQQVFTGAVELGVTCVLPSELCHILRVEQFTARPNFPYLYINKWLYWLLIDWIMLTWLTSLFNTCGLQKGQTEAWQWDTIPYSHDSKLEIFYMHDHIHVMTPDTAFKIS